LLVWEQIYSDHLLNQLVQLLSYHQLQSNSLQQQTHFTSH